MLITLKKISFTILLIFCFTFVCCAEGAVQISASSAILIDGDTLEVLYEKNSEAKRSMASTTKIMTALIAVESGRLDETVNIKNNPYVEGTAIGFNAGDKLTLETLCYAMLLESGNDAAVVVAEYLGKSEEKFSDMMNRKAAEIGMKNTNFVTASGLDAQEHYTTAYDMALLGAYAVKNEIFREICSTKSYKAQFLQPETVRYFSNHNKLLSSCDGVIGLKTGYTKKSGRCLASACERNGKLLVAVTLNAPDDWNDHKKLYDYGYSLYGYTELAVNIPDSVAVYGSDKKAFKTECSAEYELYVLKGSVVTKKIFMRSFFYAPIERNDVIGKISFFQNGSLIAEYPILSGEDADVLKKYKIYKPSVFSRIINYITNIR